MAYKVLVNPHIIKIAKEMSKSEKESFVSAVNLMQLVGQMGSPMIREFNVWRCRSGNVRIIYTIKNKNITLINVFIGVNAT